MKEKENILLSDDEQRGVLIKAAIEAIRPGMSQKEIAYEAGVRIQVRAYEINKSQT